MLVRELNISKLTDNEQGNGIFYYINKHNELHIGKVIDVETIDALFLARHGQRKLSPLAENIIGDREPTVQTMDTLGKLLSMYVEKWNNLYNIYMEEVTLDSYKITTKEDEKTNSKDEQETSSSSQSKNSNLISGYDSDSLVPESESLNDDSDNSNMIISKDNNRELNRTVIGSQGNRLDDRAKALQLLETSYIDILLQDVANELGLLIY